ncbi:MAG TPA: cell division topological specificity factor MinE [Geminicoccus sp.]|uniref:cell division topological specificity factor MinE n=1 Tax=Geminicoccus sp. TaxID=2024832 RepID=UPI002D1E252E|nr:cell division topological specificity factor MinE [Geminicoccus sp.]HWL68119.1 cell division topological specificity factor MinE [Geminicoccus sp.]
MNLLDRFFGRQPKNTAVEAKDRLKILLAHERVTTNAPDFLPMMKQEILEVIRKYIQIDKDQVKVHMQRQQGVSVLELEVELPQGPSGKSASLSLA